MKKIMKKSFDFVGEVEIFKTQILNETKYLYFDNISSKVSREEFYGVQLRFKILKF